MNIKLPEVQTDLLDGHHPAGQIAESLIVAYWLHNRDNSTALYHLKAAHESMHRLADALGYTLTPKDQ
jgi:hypothetical protein